MSEDLYRVVYTSRASRPMTRGELDDMLQGSRRRNVENGITGLMLYEAGNFIQVIEGPRKLVDDLYDKIAQDPRHRAVERISAGPVESRDFESWSMGFSDLALFKDFDVSAFREELAGSEPLDPRGTYQLLLRFREALKS